MSDAEILTQDEKDTLLNGVPDKNGSVDTTDPDGGISRYDFKHPAHKLKAHLPLLEVANHRFSARFTSELTTLLRQKAEVTLDNFSMLKFEEYTHSLENGGSNNRVKLAPLPGTSLMHLDADLVFTLVDRFFGGAGNKPENPTNRPFTHTEQRLIDHAISAAFTSLASAWSTMFDITPEFVRAEISSQMTSTANPSDVLVVSKFKVSFAKGEGQFHIAIPYSSLDPVKPLLKASIDKPSAGNDEWSRKFNGMVIDSSVEVQGIISETSINLRRLSQFKPGDFIALGQNQQATFYAENIPLFNAVIGASNGMISAKIL